LEVPVIKKSNTTSYTLQGGAIEDVNKYKYLGVWVEKSLKWLEHIKYITNKGRKNFEFVMRNLKGASKEVKERAYTTMIRPILEYASSAWDPHLSRDVLELEKVQKRSASRVYIMRAL
jgi:hypothetical protein